MGVRILYYVQNIWPFSAFKYDDLKVSNALVRKLSIPEHTKQFVYAIPDQESGSVIYILCAQNLSERSDLDVECVIRGIKPEAVIAQVGDVAVNEILGAKGDECGRDTKIDVRVPSSYVELLKRFVVNGIKEEVGDSVPTSSFEVLRRCFVHKIGRERYEDMAGSLVLKEIFGVGFYRHFLTAKRVAEEVGSSFLLLESPILKPGDVGNYSGEGESGNKFKVLGFQPSSLVSQKAVSMIPSSSRGLGLANDIYLKLVKALSAQVVPPNSSEVGTSSIQPQADYVPPQFAQSVYPLLVDLHNIFADIPSIGRGLAHAQKMLYDVYRGESVDSHVLSEVYIFRIAVEGLRIALNNAGQLPINEIRDQSSVETEFSDLPVEDKSHALLAHALKSQGKKFKSVVAIVDASGLSGLRKHWNTPVPPEVKDMVEQLVTDCRNGESTDNEKKRLLTDKPVVAVGAGATAVLGASSLSKVIPASTFMKLVPTSLKLMITLPQKAFAIALSKTLGPSKIVAPGLASKTSVLKATASAEKIRAVAHSLIASAEKTSLSAMRSAFYEIMRKRHVKPVGLLPWITFGGSVAMCTSLLVCGDGIECAVESFPAAHSIANLGRGIQNLHEAAQSAGKMESSRIQKSIESILYRFKR